MDVLPGEQVAITGALNLNRATDVPFGQITFSAGIADVFAFPDRRAALKAADAALYRAKQGGRNRVCRFPVDPA